jgi:hypothetical protein
MWLFILLFSVELLEIAVYNPFRGENRKKDNLKN